MALDCILAVRLSAAFDCLTPATTGTSRDPKTPGECHLYLAEGCHLYIALTHICDYGNSALAVGLNINLWLACVAFDNRGPHYDLLRLHCRGIGNRAFYRCLKGVFST